MANASVEKLKALGLRHGEKAVMGLAVALCLVFIAKALATNANVENPREVIQEVNRTKESFAVKKRVSEIDDLIKQDVGVVELPPAVPDTRNSETYAPLANALVPPEPGAGLLRDTPQLIAPTNLYVHSGRGGFKVFDLDEKGEMKVAPPAADDEGAPKRAGRRRRNRGGMPGMMGGMPGMMGGMPGMMGGMPGMPGAGRRGGALAKADAEEAKKPDATVVGPDAPVAKEAAQDNADVEYVEITKGYRYVTITGILNHKKLRQNYEKALKLDPAQAHPNYQRLEVERQALVEGQWGEWAPADRDLNQKILSNIPMAENEKTPEEVRFQTVGGVGLVDNLPLLLFGEWNAVHIGSLMAPQVREAATKGASAKGDMGSMMKMYAKKSNTPTMPAPGAGRGMPGMPGMPGAGGAGGMGGTAAENTNFWKSEAGQIMVRSIDFSVEPNTTYRYRVRIVVKNPNENRDDVLPGVDKTSPELFGPWSETTDEVTVPADVSAYAMGKPPSTPDKRNDKVVFQVARWNPADGSTLVHNFTSGPGQVVGERANVKVPDPEGEAPKTKPIDFNSRLLVVDALGEDRSGTQLPVGGANFDSPTIALLLRPDGSIAVRNQARDVGDDNMKEMKKAYVKSVTVDTKASGARGGMPGMPGMGGGMPGMGGGMPGMGGGMPGMPGMPGMGGGRRGRR